MDSQENLPLLERCRSLSTGDTTPGPALMRSVLNVGDLSDTEIDALGRADTSKPYGRRVLFATDQLEGMLATWTRDTPCRPHDHGGSFGAVRVLRGVSHHKIWKVVDGELPCVFEELVEPGGVMACGRDVIHSMGDAGAEDGLVTLHLYHDAIDHMVVYDQDAGTTYVVEGNCGAWIPTDEPELIRSTHEGIVAPKHLLK